MVKLLILVAGLAAITFIAWWFLGQHQLPTAQAKMTTNQQSVNIEVKGGYSPEKVILKQGVPATLNFKRLDSASCLDHIVFADLGINQELPQGKVEPIVIDTTKPGEYDWECSMNMFHGKVIIR